MTKLVAVEGDAKRLDRFELVAELASGGMATVYLARLSGVGGFQRFVAIKRLHPHLARDAEFIEMFLDEARLAARIHHPNVVPILEIGTSEDGYYLVMEYVEGDTLGRLLARAAQGASRIPTAIGVRIVLDALAGLHAAHELKDDDGAPLALVHRDVSPQNVLVGIDGSARIADFGVARATSRLSTTRTGQLKGKLAYMAPEQAKSAKDIDRRADIFAMGTVLWELFACKRLFKGDGEAETLNRVLHDPIPPVRSVFPALPAALDMVVCRALDRDRDRRYATAAEFADALERAARVVGAFGAHREVAAYIEEVIGTDISQQRDAVRAWLARSEPSRNGLPKPSDSERDLQNETKVEGGRKREVSAPLQPDIGSSSGVSRTPPPSNTPLPAPTRRRRWPWAVALLAAGGATATFMILRMMTERPAAATTAEMASAGLVATAAPPPLLEAPSATMSAAAVPSSSASGAPPSPSVTAAATGSAPALVAAPSTSGPSQPKRPIVIVPPRKPPRAAASATEAPASDDISSKNPYR